MSVRASAAAALLVVVAAVAFAHDTADAVVFTLVDAQMETIRDPLSATVRFQATPESDLIYRMSPRVPGSLARGRDIVEAAAFTDFGDDRQANVRIEFPPMVRERWSPSTLFYISKEIRVPVAISYAVRAEPVRTIEAFHISVAPRAPFLGIVLGGVLGVLATLLFLFLLGLRDDHKKVLTRDYLIRGLARFALGVCVTLLVVFLLLYAPKQIENLPIKADVKDWVGGFIVGLFSQFLAEWFAKKLRPEEPAAQPQSTPKSRP